MLLRVNINNNANIFFKMLKRNKSVNPKVSTKMHLRQPTSLSKLGFIYSACEPFTKNKERTQKFKKQEIQDILIKTN